MQWLWSCIHNMGLKSLYDADYCHPAHSSSTPAHFAQVGTLQMHGTGTALGDPIEMNAALACLMPSSPPLSRAGPPAAPRLLPLALSAAKSSAGNAEAAAGLEAVSFA